MILVDDKRDVGAFIPPSLFFLQGEASSNRNGYCCLRERIAMSGKLFSSDIPLPDHLIKNQSCRHKGLNPLGANVGGMARPLCSRRIMASII